MKESFLIVNSETGQEMEVKIIDYFSLAVTNRTYLLYCNPENSKDNVHQFQIGVITKGKDEFQIEKMPEEDSVFIQNMLRELTNEYSPTPTLDAYGYRQEEKESLKNYLLKEVSSHTLSFSDESYRSLVKQRMFALKEIAEIHKNDKLERKKGLIVFIPMLILVVGALGFIVYKEWDQIEKKLFQKEEKRVEEKYPQKYLLYEKDLKYGLMNQKGEKVIRAEYEATSKILALQYIEDMELVIAHKNNKMGILDVNGDIFLQF